MSVLCVCLLSSLVLCRPRRLGPRKTPCWQLPPFHSLSLFLTATPFPTFFSRVPPCLSSSNFKTTSFDKFFFRALSFLNGIKAAFVGSMMVTDFLKRGLWRALGRLALMGALGPERSGLYLGFPACRLLDDIRARASWSDGHSGLVPVPSWPFFPCWPFLARPLSAVGELPRENPMWL